MSHTFSRRSLLATVAALALPVPRLLKSVPANLPEQAASHSIRNAGPFEIWLKDRSGEYPDEHVLNAETRREAKAFLDEWKLDDCGCDAVVILNGIPLANVEPEPEIPDAFEELPIWEVINQAGNVEFRYFERQTAERFANAVNYNHGRELLTIRERVCCVCPMVKGGGA